MRRPRAQTPFRLLSALLATLVTVLAAGLMACDGGGDASPTPSETATPSPSITSTPTAGGTTRVFVYLLRGEKLGVAERLVPRTSAVAAAALRELCAGPTDEEQAAGLTSNVPESTELLGVTIRDGVAYVDLSSEYASGGGSLSMKAPDQHSE